MQCSFHATITRNPVLQRIDAVNILLTQDSQRAKGEFAQGHTAGCWCYQTQNPDFGRPVQCSSYQLHLSVWFKHTWNKFVLW